jgi:aminopeptidase N
MGYLGMDRSLSGVGLLFDYIIVHESGHEWFGNNISINDVAYSWIHEGFTTYSETLFAECLAGKEKAFKYQQGEWRNIENDSPMEGEAGKCDGGSGDHYDKGAAMIHMIRMIMNDDEKFKSMLQSMNSEFYHQTIDGKQMEGFINDVSMKDFSKLFDQYLRTNQVPNLELLKSENNVIQYRWTNCIDGFNMPLTILLENEEIWLYPTTEWQEFETELDLKNDVLINKNYYITVSKK